MVAARMGSNGFLGPGGICALSRRGAARTQAWSPAPPTWGRGPSNDSVQRVGGGSCAGSSGRHSFLPSTAQSPPRGSPECRPRCWLLALLAAPGPCASRAESAPAPQPDAEPQPRPQPGPGSGNATHTGTGAAAGGGGSSNSSGDALVTRISSLLRDLPTLKAAVIVACAFSALLIACLLLRVFRSGKRLKKTRKYDIITTPAERVEMAPLNEEDDEDEDSTVFDIKYR
ncbi:membrane protein FAM174B [Trichechus manatus latirostris]|uniref:Membrane protein FAM174B n=1 Tax=Trichechus manatus latirostris TaxID=127582 RepID=A0A2Y9QJG1_TRIMA|nr:membrane protein FAM174B [Trichechus manatus latirostris]